MSLPPPLHDPAHIETRLLVVAEMLERAVAEVRKAMNDLKTSGDRSASHPSTGSHPDLTGSIDV